MPDAPADAGVLAQPAAKRFRRSTSDLIREQRLRQQAQQAQQAAAAAAPTSEALVLAEEAAAVPLQFADPISSQVDTQDFRVADSALSFEVAAKSRIRQLEQALQQEKQDAVKPTEAEPVLTSSEDLASDLSIKTALKFATSHGTFRWLRRIPAVLRCQPSGSTLGAAREAVLQVCKDCFPKLMKDPDKAVRWLERIAACLTWYRVEGPAVPTTPATASGAGPEERAAWRRVEEWDEAYRGLEQLLRQGLLPAFRVQTDRFSVTVFGEGAGPWKCPRTGAPKRPSSSAPCAVLCPSADELRRMLQENHVSFEVAEICGSSTSSTSPAGGRELKGRVSEEAPARSQDAGDKAIVAAGAAPAHSLMEDIRSEMRELRRGGEKVVTPDEMDHVMPLSSALWFEGAWRVHALLDVLRQHFLGEPLPSAPVSPARLPRLLAPASFPHAAVQSAEVVRTQTVQGGSSPAGATVVEKQAQAQHIAELSGCFFPSQVRRLSELMTVLLPSFSCSLTVEPRLCTGINAFTHLGMRHVESVEFECVDTGSGSAPCLKWDFKLAA
mmetsp:Transcript_135849/g.422016  ORF Transcript_135849/g.422016 Transcript_135849/m.422016 type:complete len:554 (-) Transcript_135849:52-1713(-)